MKIKFKFLLVFVFIFNLYLLPAFSQELQQYGYLLVNIIDANKTVVNDNKSEQLINIDDRLNATFKAFNVFSYKYAYPKVKSEYLQKFASIECKCDVEALARYLEEHFSAYFTDVEYAKELGYPDYTPSDVMWTSKNVDGTPTLWHLNKIEAR